MFNYSGKTDVGTTLKTNEDWIGGLVVNNTLFLVCIDGFGGQGNNNPLSERIVNEVFNFIKGNYYKENYQLLHFTLKHSVFIANEIINTAKIISPDKYKNHGASMTICGIMSSNKMLTFHMGITRLYLLRNGQLYCGTEDNSEAYELLKQHKITKEEFENHEGRNKITQGLGYPGTIKPINVSAQLQKEDIVFLVTDGIYRTLGDERMKRLILEAGNLDTSVDWLIEGAKKVGSTDNLSAIVCLCH